MKKKFAKVISTLLLIGLLCGMFTLLIACDKQPKYEIKLYDENWQELEKYKNTANSSYKWDYYEFEYDGKPKAFNAIAYRNGEEFYRLYYTSYDINTKIIAILSASKNTDYATVMSTEKLPVNRGEYYLKYDFYPRDPSRGENYYFAGEPFPSWYEYSREIKFKIV